MRKPSCWQCGNPVNNIPPFLTKLRVFTCRKCVGEPYYAAPKWRIWVRSGESEGSPVDTVVEAC